MLINKHWTVIVQLLLSWYWTVTIQHLLRFLTIFRVIKLHFKWDWYKATSSLRKENPVLPLRQSKLLINKHWTVTVQLLLFWYWIVTVRPLLIFLTTSKVIELHFKRDWSRWKAKTRGYKFSKEEEPSSASKTVKIAY